MADEIKLTPEQEQIVLNAFQMDPEPTIKKLVQLIYPNIEDADGRSKEGRVIKELLASKGLKWRTTADYQPKPRLELTEENKEFIKKHCDKMTLVDLARFVFNNPSITNLHVETKTIAEYIKTISADVPRNIAEQAEDVPMEAKYKPPKSVQGVFIKVERHVLNHGMDKNNFKASEKKQLEMLLAYMNTDRFVRQINIYDTQISRDLFESSFVRYTYDKSDLTEEEVDQYIVLAHEAVNSINIQIRIERLQKIMDEATTNVNPGEKARLAMSLVDAINTLQTEYNQSTTRFNTLLNSLKGKRADRLAELRSAHASILNLVQTWREEKSRLKYLVVADLRKQDLEKAVDELTSVADIRARVLGLDRREIIDG